MELQFNKTECTCLQWAVRELQNQEQTQEVRLSEGMPDIGRVIGAWGQILLRGKEWRGGGIGASGGVMVWVLYIPDDGSALQCVETWLPFQAKWDFPDTSRDGTIRTSCILRSVDARSTSARKLMVRVGVGILGEAIVPTEEDIYSPGELPPDVQLLRNTILLKLPMEAGEKAFAIDEELTVPASIPKMDKIVCYELRPELIDQKVLAGKVVFRGAAILHVLYSTEDGRLHCWDFEIPFSQFAELDRDYAQNATTSIVPAVTNLELEYGTEGSLRLKAGIIGQYVVYDDSNVALVSDAYSPHRAVILQNKQLQLPAVEDINRETIHIDHSLEQEGMRVVDVSFYLDHPCIIQNTDGVQVELPTTFQTLYYDAEGALQNSVAYQESTWSIPAEQYCDIAIAAWQSGKPHVLEGGGGASLRADILAETIVSTNRGLQMVTELELSDVKEPNPEYPSLILRKAGGDSLWNIAKNTGSTVDAIMKANQLQAEPDSKQVLLIPIS